MGFRRLLRTCATGAVLPALAAASGAHAANAIVKAIEQAKPCSRLKVSKFGVTVGLDQFKSADIQSLHVDVDDAHAKFELSGSLACRSSEAAIFRGDASAELKASLALDLTTCQFSQNTIRIVSVGGAFGFAIQAAKGDIEAALERSLAGLAKSLCK